MMNERSQLLKGILEGSILKVIDDNETYGYEIAEKLRGVGFSSISEGTIYPLLLRLEKNGLLAASYKDSPFGPKRKYYSLTELGEETLKEFFINWCEIEKGVNKLFSGSREM